VADARERKSTRDIASAGRDTARAPRSHAVCWRDGRSASCVARRARCGAACACRAACWASR